MNKLPVFLSIALLWQSFVFAQHNNNIVLDSIIKYGVRIEPALKSATGGRMRSDFNYAPVINKFLREHKYVIFPAFAVPVGRTTEENTTAVCINLQSGNRVYFPRGASIISIQKEQSNGFMVFMQNKSDIFLYGLTVIGRKSGAYKTSEYGSGLSIYNCSKITVINTTIRNSTGDGLQVTQNYLGVNKNIRIEGMNIDNATRVGVILNSVVNGYFKNFVIRNTGEKDPKKVLQPQTAFSFEPDKCENIYENCIIENLTTSNNLGPVLATANFYNLNKGASCGKKNISIEIRNWTDSSTCRDCYGATLDISTPLPDKTDLSNLSGTVKIINAKLLRRGTTDDNYFLLGNKERNIGGVRYTLTNISFQNKNMRSASSYNTAPKDIKINLSSTAKKVLFQ